MSITQAMCTLFKKDVLLGDHHLDTDVIFIALYTSSATLNADTDAYITANEVSASGTNYPAGGITLPGTKSVVENSTSGCFTSGNPEWTSATFTAAGALIYNKTLYTADNNRGAIAVLNFGGNFTVTGGTFKIVFPAQTKDTAIIRID